MEIGASHFLRLELATQSQLSTPFVKDMTRMARSVVEHASKVEKQNINVEQPSSEGSNLLSMAPSSVFDPATLQERHFSESSFDEVSSALASRAGRLCENKRFLTAWPVVRYAVRARHGDVEHSPSHSRAVAHGVIVHAERYVIFNAKQACRTARGGRPQS